MSSLLPLKPTPETASDRKLEPRLVGFEDESAEQILSAVTSTTARRILNQLYHEPTTASDIATELDSSVQNVSYHLNRLQGADLVEVIETWYSEQGREMDVYAPSNSALVLFAGAERTAPSLTTALRRVFGAVGLVGVISGIVHTRWSVLTPSSSLRGAEPPVQQPDPTMWETLVTFGTGPGGFVLGIGVFLILFLFMAWYWQTYRPARSRTQSM
ncbi:ArsR/SmtB family transcription factor [Halorubrum distributum]|uniref:Helix-turn-helix domain-containing protein n=1 Tax=Halorubrum distributum TaxID=29283 RepID=A0A6B1IWQ1_9EURY|nr:helix-turn-helix domain-containing protein [Halorubrum terrestre]MYL67665.1 helix-turn-helix domain-containing protein [Halorubrum terrestre]